MIELPANYLLTMEQLLGEEFLDYLSCLKEEPNEGIRFNLLKMDLDHLQDNKVLQVLEKSFGKLDKVPWTKNGFYTEKNAKLSRHPYYYGGLYYIQEPSAMFPAASLLVEQGDKILDLCAAPGGKSTELGARLRGTGLLISNDISYSRAKALLKNIELFGIANAVVMSENPDKLAGCFPEFFDKIIVDAPCSGEGMFRKDSSLIKNWLEKGNSYYADLQKQILRAAVIMLKPGGYLLYSTCTFSPAENEMNIRWLLSEYTGLKVMPIEGLKGFMHGKPEWAGGEDRVKGAVRLWPHRVRGEGHFAALLYKEGSFCCAPKELKRETTGKNKTLVDEAANQVLACFGWGMDSPHWNHYDPVVIDSRLYAVPSMAPRTDGLRILQSGLLLGTWKGNKKRQFEPGQAFAMALKAADIKENYKINLPSGGQDVIRYLKGETLEITEKKSGWQLVCTDGYPLGFGKALGTTLKNKYSPGWRWL